MTDSTERIHNRLLVIRCQTGDSEAFREVVSQYGPRLRYFLRRLLGRTAEVDDLLQEVWYDIVRGLPRLADPAAFPAWAYRIARDRGYRYLRCRRKPDRPLDESQTPTTELVEDRFSADDAERIHRALDSLPREHSEVLSLRFLEGMTYEEMAAVIGCPLGTVRSRLHYAKHALRLHLERNPEDEAERTESAPVAARRRGHRGDL